MGIYSLKTFKASSLSITSKPNECSVPNYQLHKKVGEKPMTGLEIVKDRYCEEDLRSSRKGDQRAAIEVKFKGSSEKWTSSKLGRLTLESSSTNNQFELARGNWHIVGATPAKVEPATDLHLSRIYDRILPLLE